MAQYLDMKGVETLIELLKGYVDGKSGGSGGGGKGDKGDPGEAATVDVGTTTTGEAGTDAKVTNVGTTSAAVLDFVIPRGEQGEKGATGAAGKDGSDGKDGADGYSPSARVERTDGGAVITVTDRDGTTTAEVNDGRDGGDTMDPITDAEIDGLLTGFGTLVITARGDGVLTLSAAQSGTEIAITGSVDLSGYTTTSDFGSAVSDLQKQIDGLEAGGADLTNYYTKSETDILLRGYATTTDFDSAVSDLQKQIDGLEAGGADLTNYYTKSETDSLLRGYATTSDLSGYAKTSDLDGYVKDGDVAAITDAEIDALF